MNRLATPPIRYNLASSTGPAWTLGEIVTALLGAGLALERVIEHPVDWWAGHRDVRPEERGRLPLSFSIVATRG